MPRDTSGNFSLAEAPFEFEETISEVEMNTVLADIADGLTQSIANDGQTPITANLPMSGFKHTGVANASARTEYAAAGQVLNDSINWCGTAGGTANALTLTPTPAITAYAAGQRFRFLSGSSFNTGATTVNVSGLGAKALWVDGAALNGQEIWPTSPYEVIYDGTRFHLTSLGVSVPSSRTNVVVNPGFSVAQERASATIAANAAGYVLDQWYHVAKATAAVVVEQKTEAGGIPALPHSQNTYIRITSDDHDRMTQPIEDVFTLAGEVVTLTFWARSSVAGATVTPSLIQYFGVGGSSDVTTLFAGARTLSTTFERFRQTVALPAIDSGATIGVGHCITLRFDLEGDGLSIDFAHVQLERGSRYSYIEPKPFHEELARCQRYWQSSYLYGVTPGAVGVGGAILGTAQNANVVSEPSVRFPVSMRIIPTVTTYAPGSGTPGKARDLTAVADVELTAGDISESGFSMWSNTNAMTAGHTISFHYRCNARL